MNLHERFICKKNNPDSHEGLFFDENRLVATMRYEQSKGTCVLTWHEGDGPISWCRKSHDCRDVREKRDAIVKAACHKYEIGELPDWFHHAQGADEVVNRIVSMLRLLVDKGDQNGA